MFIAFAHGNIQEDRDIVGLVSF